MPVLYCSSANKGLSKFSFVMIYPRLASISLSRTCKSSSFLSQSASHLLMLTCRFLSAIVPCSASDSNLKIRKNCFADYNSQKPSYATIFQYTPVDESPVTTASSMTAFLLNPFVIFGIGKSVATVSQIHVCKLLPVQLRSKREKYSRCKRL